MGLARWGRGSMVVWVWLYKDSVVYADRGLYSILASCMASSATWTRLLHALHPRHQVVAFFSSSASLSCCFHHPFAMTADSLPHTPRRPAQEHTQQIPISPIVLEIERQLLFTPDRPGAHLKSPTSLDGIATYACQGYSPRPDDFYFDGGVTKLELPDDEREVVVADEFLKDIRKLEDAIEVSRRFSGCQ